MFLSLLFSCGDPAPTYYADIKPILDARCSNCHQQGEIGGGVLVLEDPDKISRLSPLISSQTESGLMPPWPAEGGAYLNDWSLTAAEVDAIRLWADAGAPLGDPQEEGEPLPYVGTTLSRVDQLIQMQEPYTASPGDDYRCFVLDWTEPGEQYITGFNVLAGNPQIVHHVAAFLVRPDSLMADDVFEQLELWEEEDEVPGYPCFGGPSGPGSSSQIPIEQIAQWVPGNQGMDFPEGTGIAISEGSKIVLQLHYYSGPAVENTTDQSSLQLRLSDEVSSPASYSPWLNGAWPVAGMAIPAGESEVVHEAVGDPRGFFSLLNPSLELDEGFTIHSMMLHLHRLGKSASLELIRADGSEELLVNIPEWDFDWQFTYVLSEAAVFNDGDQLRLRCVFDNSAPDAVDISWGEGTSDEMCVGNLYVSTP